MVAATDYAVSCLMTNIVDLDDIGCDIEPDPDQVEMFQAHILAMRCVPYVLPVWQAGFGSYSLYPTATNAAMFAAICGLAAAGLSPDRVTVFIAPSKEYAAMLACFVADFDDEDDGKNDSYTGRYYAS
jgi:hypothetical protein